MGLDVYIIMAKNRQQVQDENFWNECHTGWVKDEDGDIDFTVPTEVYYARKFWDLYTPMCRRLDIENGDWSAPLTKEDIEEMIHIATHEKDYFDSFDTVADLCEILYNYDRATEAGMVFLFSGNY